MPTHNFTKALDHFLTITPPSGRSLRGRGYRCNRDFLVCVRVCVSFDSSIIPSVINQLINTLRIYCHVLWNSLKGENGQKNVFLKEMIIWLVISAACLCVSELACLYIYKCVRVRVHVLCVRVLTPSATVGNPQCLTLYRTRWWPLPLRQSERTHIDLNIIIILSITLASTLTHFLWMGEGGGRSVATRVIFTHLLSSVVHFGSVIVYITHKPSGKLLSFCSRHFSTLLIALVIPIVAIRCRC